MISPTELKNTPARLALIIYLVKLPMVFRVDGHSNNTNETDEHCISPGNEGKETETKNLLL
jgi:hypothetical protein